MNQIKAFANHPSPSKPQYSPYMLLMQQPLQGGYINNSNECHTHLGRDPGTQCQSFYQSPLPSKPQYHHKSILTTYATNATATTAKVQTMAINATPVLETPLLELSTCSLLTVLKSLRYMGEASIASGSATRVSPLKWITNWWLRA